MSKIFIQKIKLNGIHKRYNLELDFNSSVNILHGQNGTGKSTLIHIIANIANCDFIRFAFLNFNSIEVWYSDDTSVLIEKIIIDSQKTIRITTNENSILEFSESDAFEAERKLEDDRYVREYKPELYNHIEAFIKLNNLRHIETSYFPAFRTMLEAWASQRDESPAYRGRRRNNEKITTFSRNLFGKFLPYINFPSPLEIEENLREEIRYAQISIARYEGTVFSNSFVKVFSALLQGSQEETDTTTLLHEIRKLTNTTQNDKLGFFEENEKTYDELKNLVYGNTFSNNLNSSTASALAVYRDALIQRQKVQTDSFQDIDRYFGVVNSFLDKKILAYEFDPSKRLPKVGLKFPDGTWSSIKVMSSGERQLLTMLYAVNKMSGNSVVLIDEPELSLHIDWQEELLEKMIDQLGDRQIIVCTHSPSIAANFDEFMKSVSPVYLDKTTHNSCDMDEEEDTL